MSDKPLLDRLQVKTGRSVAVIGAPPALPALTGSRPDAPVEAADVAVLFVADRAAFEVGFPATIARIRPEAILWLAYPKLTSALAADLSRDRIWDDLRGRGWDAVAQVAVDDDWSALRVKRVR